MTEIQAAMKAKEVFGDWGYVYDRDERVGLGKYGSKIPRFYVGSGQYHYGNGNTWEEAFANVKKFREDDDHES